ncbi:MAG: hypothetical protein ACLFTR_04200 [Candidatus Woesearchaeota archaeon]
MEQGGNNKNATVGNQNGNPQDSNQQQTPQTSDQQQSVQGNVVKPQQQAMQQNAQSPVTSDASNGGKQASQNKKMSAPEPSPKKKEDMSSYEKRFRDFIKRKFGGLIGDILLDSELKNLNVKDISLLDESQQIQVMENVLEDIFKKHHMEKAKEETRMDMYVQLSLDKASNLIQQQLNDEVEIGFIEIVHNDERKIESYVAEDVEETYWCVSGKSSGSLDSWFNIIVPDRESMMLMTEYSKNKGITFNPMDEKQKQDLMFQILRLIFDSINSILGELIKTNVTYSLDELKTLDVELADEIKNSTDKREKETGAQATMTSAKFEVKVNNMTLRVLVLINK